MHIVRRQRENTMVIRVEEFAIRSRFTVDVKSGLPAVYWYMSCNILDKV